jgi:hypothetical protein
MSNFEKLAALGAEVVGGDLILKHKVLGHFRNGDLSLTAEGQKLLEADNTPNDAPSPRAPRTARKKAEAMQLDLFGEPEISLSDE